MLKKKDILACISPFGLQKVKQSPNQRVINNLSKRSEKMSKASAEIEMKLGLRMNSNGTKRRSLLAYFAPASKQKRSNDNDSSQA